MKDGVSLYGGFAGTEGSVTERAVGANPYDMTNATVLSADDDQPDVWTRIIDPMTTYRWTWETASNVVPGTKNNSSHVIYCEATLTQPTVVDGFTLTGGNASIYQAKAAGGAVYGLGSLNVKNCRITENSAFFSAESTTDSNTYGGAVYLKGGSMDNCYISKAYSHSSYGNGVGGGVYAENATITNCKFEDCVGLDQAGAVYLNGGSLDNCDFARCYSAAGGAILNNGGKVSNITVSDCRALNGGAVYNGGEVVNALVAGCYADAEEYGDNGGRGGAIYNVRGDIVNCALYNNTAFEGGGVYLKDGRVINSTVLNNSVRAENGGENIFNASDAAVVRVLNTISDAGTSMTNFVIPTAFAGRATSDAQLASLLGADWHLRLKPHTELNAVLFGTVQQGRQAIGKFFPIYAPVAQGTFAVIAAPKPAVVQNHQLKTQRRRFPYDLQQLILRHIEVAHLPTIEQDGPGPLGPLVGKQALCKKMVKLL